MTAVQLSLEVAPHNNRQLFSDHYLNETLPERTEWKNLQIPALRAMQEIREILDRFTPSSIEAQTEDGVVKPVLRALGHTYEVQPALKTPGGTKRPDYVLYGSHTALAANKDKVLTEELLRDSAFAVGDAKYWNRPLDMALKAEGGDTFTNQNPSFQISFYMQHTGLPWGILTNGRQWRLYNHDTAHKLDRFYEVDLEALVLSGDVRKFLYFYAFFRRAAFEPGPLGVQEILQQSIDYALKVGDQLKRQVFDSLRHIAQGFLDFPQNGLTLDSSTLKTIYDNSLILLYRLLFVSYAEARELLPVRESKDYRDSYSLRSITHEIADASTRGRRLLPTSGTRWPRLRELFSAIDKGSPPLNVATFNGGLFDPERHPFLELYAVGDRHLEQAIDILARVDGDFVDYRDLAEQHLGTIYEGLLEYHLESITPEDGWTIDLVNDRGERKKIGSYYTPNYIVKYIVDHTVGPVLEAVIQGKSDEEKIDAILGINVLDPAMGSAYFLVEATEYIARFIVNLALPKPDGSADEESDLAYWKRQVVQSCVYGVDINPLAVELAKLSLWLSTVLKGRPLSFLDHHLRVGNSLIGSRVAAVGESKYQKTAAKKREKSAIEAARVGQMSMLQDDAFQLSVSSAVDSMGAVERSESATVEDVKSQESTYLDLHRTLTEKYERFSNLLTSEEFGLAVDESLWPALKDFTLGRVALVPPSFHQLQADSEETATRERFFHWDLEFPEVFFDRHGRALGEEAGFHAVVGNPPYVRQERIASIKPYLRNGYRSFSSVADLYIYFFERGLQLLKKGGRLGYISSGTFARGNFAKPFRSFLPNAAQVEEIIDFGENQPFTGAEMVRPTITILTKGGQSQQFQSLFLTGSIPSSLSRAMEEQGISVEVDVLNQPEWSFQIASTTTLFRRIGQAGLPLREMLGGKIFYGIKTGLNEAFVVNDFTRNRIVMEDPSVIHLIHPLVTGQDLRPWYVDHEGRWLIVIPAGWSKDKFGFALNEEKSWAALWELHPSLAGHLAQFTDKARRRSDQGDYWWELRSCDYYPEFEKPKILWPDIAKLPRFAWDTQGRFINDTGFFLPTEDLSLLALLQSRVMWFVTSQTNQPLRLRGGLWQYRLKTQFLERLPIPKLSASDQSFLGDRALAVSNLAGLRNELHIRARNRIATDFGHPDAQFNQKLTAWWDLDFPTFRAEVQRALKTSIPVRDRDEWEEWLNAQRVKHQEITSELVRMETELNERVYSLFALSREEIATIEEITKYRYAEV